MFGLEKIEGDSLKLPEIAEALRLSKSKVYEMAAGGRIPGAVKMGSSWCVDKAVFLRALEKGSV